MLLNNYQLDCIPNRSTLIELRLSSSILGLLTVLMLRALLKARQMSALLPCFRLWTVFLVGFASAAPFGRAADIANEPPLTLRAVTVDGVSISFEPGAPIRLPSSPGKTSFQFGPSRAAANAPVRFRCRLDGYETEWHERAEGMRLLFRFENGALDEVGMKDHVVSGQSPGWTGSFSDSPFLPCRKTVMVPTNATRFWLVIQSGGPAAAVGAYAIKNLRVSCASMGPKVRHMIPHVSPDAQSGFGAGKIKIEGWEQNGLWMANARVVQCGPERETGLAVIDDSPSTHAAWDTYKVPGIPVEPGEELVFEWEEAYSIGAGDFCEVSYKKLPPKTYWFRMSGLSVNGVPNDVEAAVLVELPAPLWKTGWFWVGVAAALSGLLIAALRLIEWRRMKLRLASLEKARAVEQERFRIARDIHDDLGARVTQISLLGSTAQQKPGLSAEAQADFAAISQMSRNLVDSLSETVWAVSPEHDHLDSLVSYICQVAGQMCAQATLKLRLQIPDLPHGTPVGSAVRHNLVMTVKEAVHNIIKHSNATEVQIGIQFPGGMLAVDIRDNGKGFDASSKLRGNGLPNMRRRMEDIGGRWTLDSRPGAGTHIHLELSLAETVPLCPPVPPKSLER